MGCIWRINCKTNENVLFSHLFLIKITRVCWSLSQLSPGKRPGKQSGQAASLPLDKQAHVATLFPKNHQLAWCSCVHDVRGNRTTRRRLMHVWWEHVNSKSASHVLLFVPPLARSFKTIYSGAKKYLVSPLTVQVLQLRNMREVCNFHHWFTSTMRDKNEEKKIQEITM